MPTEGQSAPPFTLPDDAGHTVNLSDFAGRWLVLWWYPKASTGG